MDIITLITDAVYQCELQSPLGTKNIKQKI